MRFLPKQETQYPNGTKRRRSWFAWTPVTIDGETRVLETVTVEETWFEGYGSFVEPGWIQQRFL